MRLWGHCSHKASVVLQVDEKAQKPLDEAENVHILTHHLTVAIILYVYRQWDLGLAPYPFQ